MLDDVGDGGLGEFLFGLDEMVERATRAGLEDEVDVGRGVEEAVEGDDVGVVQEGLDFELTDQLGEEGGGEDEGFGDLFEGNEEVSGFVQGEVDLGKFAGTKGREEKEVGEFKRCAGWGCSAGGGGRGGVVTEF